MSAIDRFGIYIFSAFLIVAFVPDTSRAQVQALSSNRIAESFADLQLNLSVGQLIVVTDESGKNTTGRVSALAQSSLVLIPSGKQEKRTFGEAEIRKITRTDSLRNGALIGLGVGVAAAVLVGRAAPQEGSGWMLALIPPVVGPVGGVLIDSAIGNRTIYMRNSRISQASVRISPWLGKERRGLSVSVRF